MHLLASGELSEWYRFTCCILKFLFAWGISNPEFYSKNEGRELSCKHLLINQSPIWRRIVQTLSATRPIFKAHHRCNAKGDHVLSRVSCEKVLYIGFSSRTRLRHSVNTRSNRRTFLGKPFYDGVRSIQRPAVGVPRSRSDRQTHTHTHTNTHIHEHTQTHEILA